MYKNHVIAICSFLGIGSVLENRRYQKQRSLNTKLLSNKSDQTEMRVRQKFSQSMLSSGRGHLRKD